MSPLLSRIGFSRAFGRRQGGAAIVPVRFYVELYGGQGQDFGINDNGNPPPADSNPSRRGGNGGYTKIDMTVPTAYVLDINSPVSSYPGGPGPGAAGGSASGFSINGQWMAITGGGGGARGTYTFNSGFTPVFVFGIGPGPAGGAGGGAISAGPPGGSAGSAGTRVDPTVVVSFPGGNYQESGALSGQGGGGAPGGTGSSSNGGTGGGANIRIKFETGNLSGPLAPAGFPDITMAYVTGTDGGNPRNSGNSPVIITNFNTNNTYLASSGSVPVSFIRTL